MTEIKLTKRYPQSRTEDIVDAYMRGWNDALDAVQNGKFIISDDRKIENSSEKPNNCKDEQTDWKDQMWKEACREETDRLLETQMEDEPQTKYKVTIPYGDDVPLKKIIELELKDEPQTETEVVRTIIHKIIDNTDIAEDAYPDLRQRLHDAVDEYEPKDEPQNDVSCFTCIHDDTGHIECQSCDDNYSNYEAKTEPQTEEDVLREQVRAFMGIVEQMERSE